MASCTSHSHRASMSCGHLERGNPTISQTVDRRKEPPPIPSPLLSQVYHLVTCVQIILTEYEMVQIVNTCTPGQPVPTLKFVAYYYSTTPSTKPELIPYSLGHLALETANLEQIATEFILVRLVSIYSLVLQKKKSKELYMEEHVKILTFLTTPLPPTL